MCKNDRKKKLFFISNSDSSSTKMNNFSIIMNNSITTEQGSSISNLKKYFNPINLSIDLAYFNISSSFKNNQFAVQSVGINNNVASVLTIPNGNYNGATLQTAVLSVLNNANLTWNAGNVISWVGTVFNVNGNFTFGYSTAKPAGVSTQDASIKITFNSVGNFNSKKIFGSIDDFISIAYGVGNSGSIVSSVSTTGIMDLIPINALFIRSNIAKSFYKMVGTDNNKRLEYSDILLVLQIGSNIGGTLIEEFGDDDYYQEIKPNYSILEFRITDKDNNLIEFLDGSEFNMTFAIEEEAIILNSENINKNNIDKLQYQ
jgi:hypothetical protein